MNNDVSSVVWPWREHPAGKTESKKAGHSWIAAAVQACALVAMGFLSHGKHPVLGNILWGLALVMGAANLVGGLTGARTALRHGNAFVRRVFLAVVSVLAVTLAWEVVARLAG